MMRISRSATVIVFVFVVVLSVFPISSRFAPARAAGLPSRAAAVSYSDAVPGFLYGVADISASDAWAVGDGPPSLKAQPLVLHWNGTRWSKVTISRAMIPGMASGELDAVDAVSANDVWAVGLYSAGDIGSTTDKTLILHWNGKTWTLDKNAPTLLGGLDAVSVSGGTGWAVGQATNIGSNSTTLAAPLALHLAGGKWSVVPVTTTDASSIDTLMAVATTGAESAWVGGLSGSLWRWNGSELKAYWSPSSKLVKTIFGLAAGPRGATWLIRQPQSNNPAASKPQMMLWNGKSWHSTPTLTPPTSNLYAVTFIPGGTAWAVGNALDNGTYSGLIVRWTGQNWTRVAIPNPNDFGMLSGVSASSTKDAWAVGQYHPTDASGAMTLLVHWNGKIWQALP